MLRGENNVRPAPPATDRAADGPVEPEELSEGLLLLRASTMKVVRLQLAMERRDRRVAFEALDDLVLLDARLSDFLAAMPSELSDPPLQRRLDEEHDALVRERLILAAGAVGPALSRDRPRWIEPTFEPAPVPPETAPVETIEAAAANGGPQRRALPALLVLALLLMALLIAGAAGLFGTAAGQELRDRIFSTSGDL